MLFSGIEFPIVAAYYSQHQPGSEVVSFSLDCPFEIRTSEHWTIKTEEMFSNEEGKDYVRWIKNKRLFEVSYSAFCVALDVEIGARIEEACEQIEVLSSKPAQHVLYALIKRFLFTGLFVMFSNSVAPQGLQLSALDRSSLGKVLDQRIKHRMVVEPAGGLPVNKIEYKLE